MVKRNLIANYLGQGWSAIMGIAFVPLYIKYLGVEAYGLIGLFAMIQAWMAILDSGMVSALGREMAKFSGGGLDGTSIRSLLRSIEIIIIALCCVVGLSLWGASGWIAQHWLQASQLSDASVQQAVSIIGAVVGLRLVENVYRSCLIGLQYQVAANVVIALMATLRGLGAVGVLVWISPSITNYFVWQGLVSVVASLLFAMVTYRVLPVTEKVVRFSVDGLRQIWKFAGGVSGITILALLLTQLDKLLLTHFLTLESFGIYAFTTTVASVLYMMAAPITQAYFPRFVELITQKNWSGLATSFHQSTQLISISVGSVSIMMVLFSTQLLTLWTSNGELAHAAGPLLPVVAIGTMFNAFMYIPVQMQMAHGWTSLVFWTNLIAVLILAPTIFLVVPKAGAMGAAWIWTLLNVGYIAISALLMFNRILKSERSHWYVRGLLIPICVGAVAGVIGRLVFPHEASQVMQLLMLVTIWSCVVVAMLSTTSIVGPRMFHFVAKQFDR